MKKLIYILVLVIGSCNLITAQSEKIKGNRNVTIKQTYIDDFDTIVLGSDFSIEIIYNSKPSVEIEADDNLHDVIEFGVSNGVLTFAKNKRITSKKKLQITVNYGDALSNIEVKDKAEIRSLTSMELGNTTLKTLGNSRAYLNIKAKIFDFKSSGKSKTRLNLTADSTTVEISDDSKVDALINTKATTFDLYQRADATIEGDTNTALIRLDNSSNFYAKNFGINTGTLLIEGNSDASIMVKEAVIIEASESTETYLYGEPTVTLKTFSGSAKLQKKELK